MFLKNTKNENLHCSTASEPYACVKSLVQEKSGFHQSSLSLSISPSLVLLLSPPPQLRGGSCVLQRQQHYDHMKKMETKQKKERQGMKQRADLIKSSSVNEEIRLDGSPLLSLQAVRSNTNCNR